MGSAIKAQAGREAERGAHGSAHRHVPARTDAAAVEVKAEGVSEQRAADAAREGDVERHAA